MGLYFSSKQAKFVTIDSMNTRHITNAILKIRSGTHNFYTAASDYKLIELLLELEKRNVEQLEVLKGTVAGLTLKVRSAELRLAAVVNTPDSENRYIRPTLLADMRTIALRLIAKNGLVTADTLRLALNTALPYTIFSNYHGLAHVFKDKRFKKIGFLQSKIRSNHGRYISVWGASAAL